MLNFTQMKKKAINKPTTQDGRGAKKKKEKKSPFEIFQQKKHQRSTMPMPERIAQRIFEINDIKRCNRENIKQRLEKCDDFFMNTQAVHNENIHYDQMVQNNNIYYDSAVEYDIYRTKSGLFPAEKQFTKIPNLVFEQFCSKEFDTEKEVAPGVMRPVYRRDQMLDICDRSSFISKMTDMLHSFHYKALALSTDNPKYALKVHAVMKKTVADCAENIRRTVLGYKHLKHVYLCDILPALFSSIVFYEEETVYNFFASNDAAHKALQCVKNGDVFINYAWLPHDRNEIFYFPLLLPYIHMAIVVSHELYKEQENITKQ